MENYDFCDIEMLFKKLLEFLMKIIFQANIHLIMIPGNFSIEKWGKIDDDMKNIEKLN
jgi:hypothetical protein